MSTETDSLRLTMHEICRNAMDAVSNQPGDTPERTASRRRAVADTISSMFPNDPTETMLAGQCVMFDHVIRDATGDLLRGQTEDIKLRARPQICGAGRMFLAHLAKFEQLQARAEAKIGVQTQAEETPRPNAQPPAQTPAPAQSEAPTATDQPAPMPAEEPVPESVQQAAPEAPIAARELAIAPARDPVRPEPDDSLSRQSKAAMPQAVERELSKILAQYGRPDQAEDDTMITTWRDPSHAEAAGRPSPPLQRQSEPSSEPENADTAQTERVEEPV